MRKSYIIILVFLVIIAIGCTNQKNVPVIQKKEERATISFQEQFKVAADDHRFIESDIYQVNNIFSNKKTAIVFIGFPDCPKCNQIVPVLDKVAKDNDIKHIYYFNAIDERKDNTRAYKTLIKTIEINLGFDEYGNPELVMPLTLFIQDGNVLNAYQGSAINAPIDTNELDQILFDNLAKIFDEYAKKIYPKEL